MYNNASYRELGIVTEIGENDFFKFRTRGLSVDFRYDLDDTIKIFLHTRFNAFLAN